MISHKKPSTLFPISIFIFILFLTTDIFADKYNFLHIGECLSYKIFWMNFHAGDTVMKVEEDAFQNGEKCYKLVTETYSSRYVSFFYPVKDRVTSMVDKKKFLPYVYEKSLNEGNYREKKVIKFDYIKGEATDKDSIYKIPKWVQDPFSAIYYFRNLPLEIDKDVSFDVFDGEKNFKLLIKVIKKETIKVPAGIFNTIKIEPIVAGAKGLFKHEGKIYVWVSDDEKRIPVLIESGVLIGAISVQLIEYK
ncbi:DUF3108 domain-containing protein [Candidatus Poribacteria bacterium]|nr:DUF3108 domain-containing protein [Candidatus Poribacteria bacterium]